jgi:nickel/cobalt transporter (NicO) family protein
MDIERKIAVRHIAVGLSALLAVLVLYTVADAHPLGVSSVNRYAVLHLESGEIAIDYKIDFAEIPAAAELESMGIKTSDEISPAARESYLDRLAARITPEMILHVNGKSTALRVVSKELSVVPGDAGQNTLKVAIEWRAPRPDTTGDLTVMFQDHWLSSRAGWREIDVPDSPYGAVRSTMLPKNNPRPGPKAAYQTGMIADFPREDAIQAAFRPLAGAGRALHSSSEHHGADGSSMDENRIAKFLRRPDWSLSFLAFAFAFAVALGAGHALTPGHGKMIVAAYLVGSRGRPRDALILGCTVTFTHTASVFALGFLALAIEKWFGVDRFVRVLEMVSGLLIVGIAAWQLPGRFRHWRLGENDAGHRHHHENVYFHDHGDGHVHSHALPDEKAPKSSLIALGISGGLVPCPGALVVLLTAISLHRLALGIGLLVAFSFGLAAVLTAVGLLFVTARDRFDRLKMTGTLGRLLPVVSSILVFLLGMLIFFKGVLAQ